MCLTNANEPPEQREEHPTRQDLEQQIQRCKKGCAGTPALVPIGSIDIKERVLIMCSICGTATGPGTPKDVIDQWNSQQKKD